MDVQSLSTRALQAYGAACMARFCGEVRIASEHVTTLVAHLISVLTAEDLPAWEATGDRLELSGRRDPLPDGIGVPPSLDLDFRRLVEHVVEIGLIDLYGSDSDQPKRFLSTALEILTEHGIEPPSPVDVLGIGSCQSSSGWGTPHSEAMRERAQDWCSHELARATS